ncbi:TonB-dependent receptor [Phenylobacterium montanum]|uniref:TonB-dependent receptor n=1 Tax=Phenylobacterium montanum TaxID=2823693 RepID=A0A975FXT9_9CAUL|nr:TonB-dependent receptor [Caulobacter sp. S6]QUD87395.1 TonB-dependent receptor [Caulobacter sp. S6]
MRGYLSQRRLRGATWSATFLASTMLTGAGAAYAADQAAAPAAAAPSNQIQEVVVTAQKREENIQKVPMSIQALDTKKLTQLNVTEFNDYVKYMPSVAFQSDGPNSAQVYMRGVSSGDNGNHSGPLPTVGTYLDEMPITTIGGTLDVHIYDIARVEVLPGPQGTLYGASSEAGTMRIITNKPSTSGFSASYDAQVNQVDHGGTGYTFEGYVNVPVNDKVAVRLVAFDQHDAGYINNVLGTRTFATSGDTINNAGFVKKAFNDVDNFGGRAALKWDINDNWSVEPTLIGQDTRANGVFAYEPAYGYLNVERFQPDTDHDKWGAATLAINGKLGRFSLVYAGSYFVRRQDTKTDYTDYSIFYDQQYHSGAYWVDSNGNPLASPQQEIVGTDKFTKESHELRISSPSTDRFRIIGGFFEQRQTHWILQDYQINGLAASSSVTGWPGTIWLTDQMRVDRDIAGFGEASFDITPQLTATFGLRGYQYRNSLEGFFGYGIGYSSHTGEARCFDFIHYRGDPCVNLNKTVSGSGETHKLNLTYKINSDDLVYATYSTGFRPGGVNRNANFGAYTPDTLDNYEIGWKTSLFDRTVRFNGAIYYEKWNGFQYSFLGPNSLTIIENGPNANIYGIETSIDWRATDHLTLSFNGAYNDAKTAGVLCAVFAEVPCAAADVSAPKGQRLPYTPPFKGNVTARYTFTLADWDAHVQGSLLYNNTNEVGLRTQDVIDYGNIPSYTTADFAFGAEHGSMSAELYVKNAFNTHASLNNFLPCGSTCALSFPGLPTPRYVVPVQPLTVGLRFGQKF